MTSAQLPNGIATSDVLVAHLQEIIVEYESYKKQFRRAESREPVSVPVEAIQLDAELRPCSEPFHMVTRDMSCGGVGMFHTEPVASEFLALKFSSPVSLESFSVLARVGHCSPCGHYYIVGCTFVTDPAELED